MILVKGDRHLPFAFAQNLLQPGQDGQWRRDRTGVPLGVERGGQTLEIAGGVVHVGRRHSNEQKPGGRIHLDDIFGGCLPHDLPMHLAVRRHVQNRISQDLGLASQAPARRQAAQSVITLFDGVPGG